MTPPSYSVQSKAMDQVVKMLAGAGGARSHRCHMTAFNSDQLPAIDVVPDDGEAEYIDSNSIERIFRFRVRYVGQAIDEVDKAIDPIYVAGVKALNADPTLGGLVLSTRERGQKWEMEKGEFASVALAVTYEVEFSTTRSDPSVSWP